MNLMARAEAALQNKSQPGIEWEETACPLCGSRRWIPLIEAPDNMPGNEGLWFAVVRCLECDLCFTNPRPSKQCIGRFYTPAYWRERAPGPSDLQNKPRAVRRWCRPRKERDILTWHGQGRLLDFGCGEGAFLHRMHRQGWHVIGLDLYPKPVQHIQKNLGLPALQGTLPHAQLQPESFDLITMWHSLEHVHNPREVLEQAYFLLAPGGILMTAVPNIDSLPFQWFGPNWFGLDLPRHLTHFSPKTLHCLMERTGFRVNSLHMIRQCGWMRASAQQSRKTGSLSRFHWPSWLQGKHLSRIATWYTSFKQQCDCILVTAERRD